MHIGIEDTPSSLQWIMEHSPCYHLQGNKSTILAWVHSHVNGSKCFLSSIDMHTQFVLENNFPHILAIVVEIGPKDKVRNEYYQITEKGKQRIASCNNEKKQSPNIFHKSCSYPRFFRSLKSQVTFINDAFFTIDKRNPQHFSSQEVSGADYNAIDCGKINKRQAAYDHEEGNKVTKRKCRENPATQNSNENVECKGCGEVRKLNTILKHLQSKGSECKKHYSNEDFLVLEKKRDQARKEYNKQYRQKNQQKQKKYQQEHQQKLQKYQQQYQVKNKDRIKERKSANRVVNTVQRSICRVNQRNSRTPDDRLLLFKRDIVDGPNFVCLSCNRTLFKNQVKISNSKDIEKLLKKIDENLLTEAGLGDIGDKVEVIFCHSCSKKINQNKLPSMNINNGLKLDDVPYELSSMSDLEQQLIAKYLLFVKIKKLPKTRMGAVEGRVISVPIECQDISRYISFIINAPL